MTRKTAFYIIAVVVVAAVAIFYLGFSCLHVYGLNSSVNKEGPVGNFPLGRINVNGTSYNVYVANTLPLQEQGYMNATSIGNCNGLGDCAGMLFVFNNESRQCFWMKNTLIALKQSWIYNSVVNYTYVGMPLSDIVVCSPGNMILESTPAFRINISDNVSFLGFINNST